MKCLYDVTIHGYVMAETAGNARQVAEFGLRPYDCDIEIYLAESVDDFWWHCIPFGSDDDRTCGQILKAQKGGSDG